MSAPATPEPELSEIEALDELREAIEDLDVIEALLSGHRGDRALLPDGPALGGTLCRISTRVCDAHRVLAAYHRLRAAAAPGGAP